MFKKEIFIISGLSFTRLENLKLPYSYKKKMYNKRYFIGDIYLELQDKVLITHHITQSKLYLFKTINKI